MVQWWVNPPTTAETNLWTAIKGDLGLTDFDPLKVHWNEPIKWKIEDTSSGGNIMSFAAGMLLSIGFGAFFSIVTVLLTKLEQKFAGVTITSEHFNTAGRDVKTGLTAAVIVSQWTWAATLLQSSNVAWSFGLSGPFWYASGASVQVLLFGVLAIEIKRKAPNAHTFLEMVDVRWGKCAHLTFLWYGLWTNIIVSAMLLLGGSAVMETAAGLPVWLSGLLIPAGTLIYTIVGGLKATFLASYLHTAIIFFGLVRATTPLAHFPPLRSRRRRRSFPPPQFSPRPFPPSHPCFLASLNCLRLLRTFVNTRRSS